MMSTVRLSRQTLLFLRQTFKPSTSSAEFLTRRQSSLLHDTTYVSARRFRHPPSRIQPSKLRKPLSRRPFSDKPPTPPKHDSTSSINPPPEEGSLSLSQRLRKLSREYGWSAVGVYLALSALDFPFCFLAVRWLGTDRIGRWEHNIVEWVKRAMPVQIPEKYRFWRQGGEGEKLVLAGGDVDEEMVYDHGVKEAEVANRGEMASIWTQLALAYAIHKSFIFIRVPLTAAITPKVVRVLRGWGWDIGKRKSKSVAAGTGAKVVEKK